MDDRSLQLDGLQVLVVDNNLDSRDLLTKIFEEYGIETIAVASAGEALEILKQAQPDLLISEIRLPCEDGYSLMCKVKALEVARQVKIPALALTVCASESECAQALALGYCKHLAKPFDIDELVAIVTCLTRQVQLPPTNKMKVAVSDNI